MLASLRNFISEQWRQIDRDHRDPSATTADAAAVLVTIALSLTLGRFAGGRGSGTRFASEIAALTGITDPELCAWVYWSAFKLVSYGFVPALCIWLVLKRKVLDHGLRFVKEPRVWLLYAAMLALVLPLAYAVSHTSAFQATYPKYKGAGASVSRLLVWELAYGFQFFMLEFFFRGFIVFALARVLGSLAIFVMIVPYCMIHFDKPVLECLGSIIAGIALGTIALRTRSIYGGVVVHCAVAWAMDGFALAHARVPLQ